MKQLIHIIIATSALLLNALSYGQAAPKAIDYTILQEKSHNPEFFTQGLILNQSKIIDLL
jgi:glutamine cyclotransferase